MKYVRAEVINEIPINSTGLRYLSDREPAKGVWVW